MRKVTILLLCILLLTSCSVSEEDNSLLVAEDSTSLMQDTLQKWEDYMESSATGLWEDSIQYDLHFEGIHSFGGEYHPNPPFFDPLFVHLTGDTLIVTDEATQSLVCMDTTGTILWKFGEGGEGPGFFAGIGQVDVCGDTIGVINNGLSFIELLSRDGVLIGRLGAVERPMDFSFIDSDRLAVFSKRQPGGDVHIVDIQSDSILYSFGDGEWVTYPNSGAYCTVWGIFLHPDSVVYMGMYESKLVFGCISERSSSWIETREMPFEITECTSYYHEETNTFRGMAFSRHSSLCIGPHGELNMVFLNVMHNGEMSRGRNISDRAPVTMVDRFDRSGTYLDTYCLPDSSISNIYYNGNGYFSAVQRRTGTIFGYRVVL